MSLIKCRINFEGDYFNVFYDGDTIFKHFILDFLRKQNRTSLLEEHNFICGGKILNSENFEKRKLKEIIKVGQTVRILPKEIRAGGPFFDFNKMRKEKVEKINTSNNESNYEKIHKGINIFGICRSQKCASCQKIVISDYNKEFIDFRDDLYDVTCPLCKGIIEPSTVAFYMCKYRIYGKKIENDKLVDFDNGYKEANSQEYCDYYDSGYLKWLFFNYGQIHFNIQKI